MVIEPRIGCQQRNIFIFSKGVYAVRGKPGTYSPSAIDGYIRKTINGVRTMDHVLVWEKHFGKKPKGYHIHHKNGVRHDNRIKNLEALKPLDHHRKHAGYKKDKKGRWLKPCNTCKKLLLMEENFYHHHQYKPSPQHECIKCSILTNLLRRNKKKLKTAKIQVAVLTKKIKARRHEK